jgi:hypothetical protein
MVRFLALLGLHYLLNFLLLPDNAVVPHPVHHDDYDNLATSLGAFAPLGVRPVSSLVIAAVAELGPRLSYGVLNLLTVVCVYLCVRFVELFLRRGEPLPSAAFVAAGAMALGFAGIVDWTRYLGLLTNATSAVLGLAALCLIARLDSQPRQDGSLAPLIVLVAALSFLAKEDFVLPLLVATTALALVAGRARWLALAGGIAVLFAAVLLFNREAGSPFVTGSASPDAPYYMALAPASLFATFKRLLLASTQAKWIVTFACVAVVAAIVVHRRERALALRLAALPLMAFSLLVPNALLPNHVAPFYAFVPLALLAATLAAAAEAWSRGLRAA